MIDMCDVLRCHELGGAGRVNLIEDPDTPRQEAGVCATHRDAIAAGEAWAWDDEVEKILMGADLDANGAVVPGEWLFTRRKGLTELVIECTTPSGQPHEPIRLRMSADELKRFVGSFRNLFPDAF